MSTPSYSAGLVYYLENPSFFILLPHVEAEIKGFLENRPVVHLKNDKATVCYLRPGIEKDIQAGFTQRKQTIDIPDRPLLDRSIFDLSNEEHPARCSKHPEDLAHLFEVCERVGLLRELFLEIVQHDTDYFQQAPTLCPPLVGLSPLGLFECACTDHKSNRVFSDTRRAAEKTIVEHILNLVPNKTDTVKVLSLASGMLLQDWKLIGLLIDAGYSRFEWTAVDPIIKKEAPLDTIKTFFQKLPCIEINLVGYEQIQDVPASIYSELHAVTVIDAAPEICNDIIALLPKLSQGAKVFYAGGSNIFSIDAQGLKTVQQSQVVKNITSDIAKEIPKIDERAIRLGVFDNWATSLHLLAAMNEHGVRSIELYTNLDRPSYYQALFPNLALHITNISREEMQEQIKTGDHLDFMLTYIFDQKMQKPATVAKTTTVYLMMYSKFIKLTA